MISAAVNGQGSTYSYDGDGRRVQKVSPAGTWTYVYDPLGNLAAEYGPSTAAGTQYISADHLGSTRLVTDQNGNAVKCYDYLPFGEELGSGTGGRGSCFGSSAYPSSPDVIDNKFTGKPRDSESGLDYFGARYFSAGQGRFTGADEPLADQHSGDPQSWNLYAYVRNNPLKFTDSTGSFQDQQTLE
ncbi:MAG: RHS repeat-associated core domain-containing protein, partial [Bryobacteraceae bacterium]